VTIDGYSQPGSTANSNGPGLQSNTVLRVELTKASAATGTGLSGPWLNAGPSVIRGLDINRFDNHGIRIGSNGNTIAGNYIGTDVSGTLTLANGGDGINIDGTAGNL